MVTKMYRSAEHDRNPFKPTLSIDGVGDQIRTLVDHERTKLYADMMYLIEARAHSLWQDGPKALKYKFSDDPTGEAITRKTELRDLIEDLKALDPRSPAA